MQPEVLVNTALLVISVAFFVILIRFFRGPTLPDRVVAVDLLGVSAVCLMVLGSARNGQMAFMDAALVIALLAFLGTIAYARYAERRGRR